MIMGYILKGGGWLWTLFDSVASAVVALVFTLVGPGRADSRRCRRAWIGLAVATWVAMMAEGSGGECAGGW